MYFRVICLTLVSCLSLFLLSACHPHRVHAPVPGKIIHPSILPVPSGKVHPHGGPPGLTKKKKHH